MTVESPGIGHRPSTSSTAVLFASPQRCGSARERAPLGAGALLVLLALGVAAPVDTLEAVLGPTFERVAEAADLHTTPWGSTQSFVYGLWRKRP